MGCRDTGGGYNGQNLLGLAHAGPRGTRRRRTHPAQRPGPVTVVARSHPTIRSLSSPAFRSGARGIPLSPPSSLQERSVPPANRSPKPGLFFSTLRLSSTPVYSSATDDSLRQPPKPQLERECEQRLGAVRAGGDSAVMSCRLVAVQPSCVSRRNRVVRPTTEFEASPQTAGPSVAAGWFRPACPYPLGQSPPSVGTG
jgi:hypothetical protein